MELNLHRLRIGIGHDTHRLIPGGPMRLGGVSIPHDSQLVGHSDADVLLHAVTDALLGAAALGDIGELFPNTSPENRNRDSCEMLSQVVRQIKAEGFEIINIDCIVFAERPQLSPHKIAMRERIASVLEIDPADVGLKAKTGEGVDAVGSHQAIHAQCVALLVRS